MYEGYIQNYLNETSNIALRCIEQHINVVERMIGIIKGVKEKKGNVFFIGVGGGSGTGSHATNDFNKIAGVSSYNLTDNASLASALANDEGWDSIFVRQLIMHNCNSNDCLFIYSVGGGSSTTSPSIVKAIDYAKQVNAKILGVVGKVDGYTARQGDAVFIVPMVHPDRVTAHTENWQLVINHLLVNAMAYGQ